MLIEFRVANHRSLRDEQVSTMEAGRVGERNPIRDRCHVSRPLGTSVNRRGL